MKSFSDIGFSDFKRFADDNSLSKYEKIGFPNDYRQGFEGLIFDDIRTKLTNLDRRDQIILDIGPGCSDLPLMIIDLCRINNHQLTLVDSDSMLKHLPNNSFVTKVGAFYPNCPELTKELNGKVDAILCYSVLHYIFLETAFFRFLDTSLSLLAPGGQMLIGDIPNVSKRKRFFSSQSGIDFHKNFMKTIDSPLVNFNAIDKDQIDDSVIFALIQRSRAQGFDAYLVPQNDNLPMANRREDILIVRP